MRRLLIILAIILLPTTVLAQSWYTANQVTVGWDAVPPIAQGDVIKYQVYTRIGTSGDGAKVGSEITASQLAITFTIEGRYFIGVKTIRYPQGETVGVPSATTSWSNDPLVCAAAGPFGVQFFALPGGIRGLKVVSQ